MKLTRLVSVLTTLILLAVLWPVAHVRAATSTHAVGTADTGNTPNTSGAFTPAVDDLLIVFVVGSATVTDAGDTLTNSGVTFTRFLSATYAASVNAIHGYVANALVPSATSQSVTFTPTDTANGTVIFVCRVAGMTRTGLNAIRQSAKEDNQGAGGTPAPAFASAALTGNPTLGVIGNNTNPAGLTEPTGWTEPASTGDLGYATPTTGGEYVFRDSGFTGTTITWGGTSASVFGSIIVELDSSSPPPGGYRRSVPTEEEGEAPNETHDFSVPCNIRIHDIAFWREPRSRFNARG